MNGIRRSRAMGGPWEGKCDTCLIWFPLDPDPVTGEEFWSRRSVRMCLACYRIDSARRRQDNREQAPTQEYQRSWRAANREAFYWKQNERRIARRMADPSIVERERAQGATRARRWRLNRRENRDGQPEALAG